MRVKHYKIYELTGQSLESALNLQLAARQYLSDNRKDPAALEKFYQSVIHTHPTEAAACGFNKPHTIIKQQDEALPRAYDEYPALFMVLHKLPMFLLYCPVDYKGDHFVPAEGTLCADSDIGNGGMGNALYKGNGIASVPLCPPTTGRTLPADFDAQKNIIYDHVGIHPARCYYAAGQSLAAANTMKQQEEEFSKSWSALFDAIQQWADRHMPGTSPSLSMRHGEEEPELEIRFGDKETGKSRPLNHPDWIIDRQVERDWKNPTTGQMEHVILDQYIARPSGATETGQDLYEAYKNFVDNQKRDIQGGLKISASAGIQTPRLYDMAGGTVLAYWNIKPEENITPPPGSREMDKTLFMWLSADAEDLSFGITPPPMPPALQRQLKALRDSDTPKGPQTPRP